MTSASPLGGLAPLTLQVAFFFAKLHYPIEMWFVLKPLLVVSSAFAWQIILDAGHGGEDRGASRGLVTEASITLSVTKQIAEALKSADPDIKIDFTRATDIYVSLEDRVQTINQKHPDLFLSVHVNSSKDVSARGQEIYFQNQLDADEESLYLANLENEGPKIKKSAAQNLPKSDIKAIVEDLERNHRLKMSGVLAEKLHENWAGDSIVRRHAIRQAPFYVISNVAAPAALVEIGYLTNPSEARKLVDVDYQKKIARGIANAVIKYKQSSKEGLDKRTRNRLD